MRIRERAPRLFASCGLALALSGCMAQATADWTLRTPDANPGVARIQFGNDLVNRGVVLRGDLDVVAAPSGTTLRGGAGAGYGWADVAPNDCLAIGVMFGGRFDFRANPFEAGLSNRAELSFAAPRDHKNESLTLIAARPAVVVGVETTTWTRTDARLFDASAGVGLRFGVISEGGPPLAKWLGNLLP